MEIIYVDARGKLVHYYRPPGLFEPIKVGQVRNLGGTFYETTKWTSRGCGRSVKVEVKPYTPNFDT